MKKLMICFTALFFAGMLTLTFTARAVHNAALPHVKVKRVETAFFPTEYGSTQALAVTTEQLAEGVFVIYTAEVNGEKRTFIRRAAIIAGQEREGYVEVVSGLSTGDRIVVSADRELCEGEVVLL